MLTGGYPQVRLYWQVFISLLESADRWLSTDRWDAIYKYMSTGEALLTGVYLFISMLTGGYPLTGAMLFTNICPQESVDR